MRSNLPARRHQKLVGRSALIERIVGWMTEGTGGGVLIHGPAGSGKTSIAVEIGHLFQADELPGGERNRVDTVVWIAARPAILTVDGLLRSPLACGTLLDFITTACAVLDASEILKALPDEQPALLQSLLAGRWALLIIDDLDEVVDSRVRSFLLSLPSTCRVIATSRKLLDFGRPIRANPLSYPDVLDLVRQLDVDEQNSLSEYEVQRLHTLSGGIPLAVVWAQNLIRLGHDVDQVLANFSESGEDLLEFCFSHAWDSLEGSAAADLLVATSLFNAGVDRPMAYSTAGLSRTPESARHHALVTLRRLSLVEYENERLSLLPMTRTFVMGNSIPLWSSDDGEELRNRWFDSISEYVAESLAQASWSECFSRLDRERLNLEELLSWASTRQMEVLFARAAALYSDLSYYFFSRGYWRQLIEHGRWALPALREQGLGEEYLTVLLTWVARVHMLQNEDRWLRSCLADAESYISEAPVEDRRLYQAILEYNRFSHLRGEHFEPVVLDSLWRAVAVFRSLDRDEWVARGLNRLGNMLSASHDFDGAIAAFTEVIETADPHLNTAWAKDMNGIALGNLGILANRQQRHTDAIDLLRQSQAMIAQSMDNAVAFMEIAIAEYHLGNLDAAAQSGRAAQELGLGLELGISIAESDPAWERDVLPRLLATSAPPADNPATRNEQVERAAAQAIDSGLLDLDAAQLEEQLGLSLQNLLLESVAAGGSTPEWAVGDYGPLSLAQRFIERQRADLCKRICMPGGAGPKREYQELFQPDSPVTAAITTLASTVLVALQASAVVVAVPPVAVYLALWVKSEGMRRFCQNCDASGG